MNLKLARLEEKIKFISEAGAAAAKIFEVKHPLAQRLAVQIFEDLAAWRIIEMESDVHLNDAKDQLRRRAVEMANENKRIMEEKGPQLWEEWHKRTLQKGHTWGSDFDAGWLRRFTLRIPCGECRNDFRQILKNVDPKIYPSYFSYSVHIHNLLNEKLDKQQMTLEIAHERWGE